MVRRCLQVRGNFDEALAIVRALGEKAPVTVVNSVNPHRIDGQKTGAFEIVDVLGDAPGCALHPGRQRWAISPHTGRVIASTGRPAGRRDFRGCSVSRQPVPHRSSNGKPVENPETVATAIRIGNPASWYGATAAASESGGGIHAVTDDEILAAYRFLASEESVFCEAASAASVAGLMKYGVPEGRRWSAS